MHKVCPKCQTNKPFEEFSKSSARKDGRRYECKPCAVKARREWALKNPDRAKELNRNWLAKDPERNRRKTRISECFIATLSFCPPRRESHIKLTTLCLCRVRQFAVCMCPGICRF